MKLSLFSLLTAVMLALAAFGCVAATPAPAPVPVPVAAPVAAPVASPPAPAPVAAAPIPVDPAAANVGSLLAALAEKSLGPIGGALAALILPMLWKKFTGQENVPPAQPKTA